jgi:predicted CoA-binding protein
VSIEGLPVYASLAAVLQKVSAADVAVSIITPPKVSVSVVRDAIDANVRHIWLQPGAEDAAVLHVASDKGFGDLIAGGPCLLVALRAGPLDD